MPAPGQYQGTTTFPGTGQFEQQPGFDPRFGPAGGVAQLDLPTPAVSIPATRKAASRRNIALIGGAGTLVVAVLVGVLLATRFFGLLAGPTDPGCKVYVGTALHAYNKTIDDLNAQASQAVLDADMRTTISDLTTAAAQAQSTPVRSALDALLAEFNVVRADVAAGSVSKSTVQALNTDSAVADSAC